MSKRVEEWVVSHSPFKGRHYMVHYVLATRADDFGLVEEHTGVVGVSAHCMRKDVWDVIGWMKHSTPTMAEELERRDPFHRRLRLLTPEPGPGGRIEIPELVKRHEESMRKRQLGKIVRLLANWDPKGMTKADRRLVGGVGDELYKLDADPDQVWEMFRHEHILPEQLLRKYRMLEEDAVIDDPEPFARCPECLNVFLDGLPSQCAIGYDECPIARGAA